MLLTVLNFFEENADNISTTFVTIVTESQYGYQILKMALVMLPPHKFVSTVLLTKLTKTNSVDLVPERNYTDRATAACRRS
jgi:hypothetical protein